MTHPTFLRASRLITAILTVIFCYFPPTAASTLSESIQGVINMRGDQAFIRIRQAREPMPLHGMTQDLVVDLQKMREGDFIVGRGEILTDRKIIALESIETVGLRQILGTWRSANWNVFEFKDFNRLTLYTAQAAPAHSTPRVTAKRQMSYTLAPGNGDSWSIFMADKQGVQIGELRFGTGARRMNMTLYDYDTGRITQRLELAPVARK